MSQQALVDFITTLSSDAALAEAFGTATNDLEGDAAFNAVAAFASDKGFDVTAADAEAFYVSLSAAQGELSDDALEDVAGGMSVATPAVIGWPNIGGGGILPGGGQPPSIVPGPFQPGIKLPIKLTW